MKTKITVLIALLITVGAIARLSAPFSSWGQLEEKSPYIIIGRCGEPTPPTPGVIILNATKSDFAIEVISVLKGGANSLSSARLETDHELRQGENYLIFGYYDSGIYKAYEEYRVVPLGANFSTNSIAGKPLDEQVQILFQQAVNHLNGEMQKDEEEKQRLEEGIKK